MAITRCDLPAGRIAAFSSTALDRISPVDAELLLATAVDDAVLLGAFQRRSEIETDLPVFRRGSGGAAARLAPGSVFLSLSLARVDALVPCTPDKLLNRYVRPLLRALGAASYFGRDWIAVNRRPAALVAFGYAASSGRALFEAVLGVTTPFSLGQRPSFRGYEPVTLGRVDVDAIVDAYENAHERRELAIDPASADPIGDEPPWDATRETPIGLLGVARDASGRVVFGGEIMVAREAPARGSVSPDDVPFGFSPADVAELAALAP